MLFFILRGWFRSSNKILSTDLLEVTYNESFRNWPWKTAKIKRSPTDLVVRFSFGLEDFNGIALEDPS